MVIDVGMDGGRPHAETESRTKEGIGNGASCWAVFFSMAFQGRALLGLACVVFTLVCLGEICDEDGAVF